MIFSSENDQTISVFIQLNVENWKTLFGATVKCVLRGGPFHFVPMNAPVETSKPLKYTPQPKPVQNKSADSPLNRYKNAIKTRVSENIEIPKKKVKRMQPFMMADTFKPEEDSDSEILPCPIPESDTEPEVLLQPQLLGIESEMLPMPAAELLTEPEVEVLPEPEPEVMSEPEPNPEVMLKQKPEVNYGRHGKSYSLMEDEMEESFDFLAEPKPTPKLLFEPEVEVLPEPEPEVISEPEPEMPLPSQSMLKPEPDVNYGRHGKSYSLMEDEMEIPFDFLSAPIQAPIKSSEPEIQTRNLTREDNDVNLSLNTKSQVNHENLYSESKPEVDVGCLALKSEPEVFVEDFDTEPTLESIVKSVDTEPKALASILTESIGRVSNANRMKAEV